MDEYIDKYIYTCIPFERVPDIFVDRYPDPAVYNVAEQRRWKSLSLKWMMLINMNWIELKTIELYDSKWSNGTLSYLVQSKETLLLHDP